MGLWGRIDGFDLEELIQIVEESDIESLEIRKLLKRVKITKAYGSVPKIPAPIPVPLPEPEIKKERKKRKQLKYDDIKSPGVGTLYLSPRPTKDNPNPEPYVKKGTRVKKGDIVGLLEHMKIYDEVRSEHSGRIREIYIEDNHPIDYGKPLFKVRLKK